MSRGGGAAALANCTVSENFASRTGGAFSLAARTGLRVSNRSAIECNMAASGGAFAAYAADNASTQLRIATTIVRHRLCAPPRLAPLVSREAKFHPFSRSQSFG